MVSIRWLKLVEKIPIACFDCAKARTLRELKLCCVKGNKKALLPKNMDECNSQWVNCRLMSNGCFKFKCCESNLLSNSSASKYSMTACLLCNIFRISSIVSSLWVINSKFVWSYISGSK